ncbi:MAG: primosomal protein N' [Proteobacteria bacterium]|jgi:primosomal protein N' (replication factor Y)|nr:primosomal protein N' [Pseudomonadota bacterium]
MSLWRVAVPVPLRRSFVYEIPAALGVPLRGARALVPFGRRRLTGYLLGAAEAGEADGLAVRPALALLDETPALPEDLVDLLTAAADYYLHPLGEVLRAALPPGIDPKSARDDFKARIGRPQETVATALPGAAERVAEIARRAPKRAAVLERIAAHGTVRAADLRGVADGLTAHLKRLAADGLVALSARDRPPDPFVGAAVERDLPPVLTGDQAKAVAAISLRLEERRYGGFLLQGVTGSGKTEVYLRVIERALDRGLGALVLVPEITLTPQLVRRYRARFGEGLAVWHSGLTDRERFDQWRLLRSGEVRVAIGVRSAVFAPVHDLAVIVVDEEHDGSFKQERGFPYHARDLALLRAARANAVAILGSATPSLEAHDNARSGKLTRLVLAHRATSLPLPRVEVVDLRYHRAGPGGQRVVSGPLHAALHETLARGEQAILFLNRRGFAPSLTCAACGQVRRCDDCAVSLTLHKRPAGLVCHYCGARHPPPDRCPACGGAELKPVGVGTEKAEEILHALFPDARVARLDRDVASGRGAEEVLDKLRTGEIDVLVGTQMVTKGHDFPRVTLVGVLLADVGLHMPDFRAAERTFQLLTQVAGRAGRSELGGRALIQTYSPDHPAIVAARTHDFEGFAALELKSRAELGYPPFGRLLALRLSGPDGGRVESAARELCRALGDARRRSGTRGAAIDILGPAPAPIAMVQGRHRWRVLLRGKRRDELRRLVLGASDVVESPPNGVRIRIDVDPVSML